MKCTKEKRFAAEKSKRGAKEGVCRQMPGERAAAEEEKSRKEEALPKARERKEKEK